MVEAIVAQRDAYRAMVLHGNMSEGDAAAPLSGDLESAQKVSENHGKGKSAGSPLRHIEAERDDARVRLETAMRQSDALQHDLKRAQDELRSLRAEKVKSDCDVVRYRERVEESRRARGYATSCVEGGEDWFSDWVMCPLSLPRCRSL